MKVATVRSDRSLCFADTKAVTLHIAEKFSSMNTSLPGPGKLEMGKTAREKNVTSDSSLPSILYG